MTVTVSGQDEDTATARVVIEAGDSPLYVVLASYEDVIWRVEGATARVDRMVLVGYVGVARRLTRSRARCYRRGRAEPLPDARAPRSTLHGWDMTYKPTPIATAGITLTDELRALTETLAQSAHDRWAARRLDEGWRHGPRRLRSRPRPRPRRTTPRRGVASRSAARRHPQGASLPRPLRRAWLTPFAGVIGSSALQPDDFDEGGITGEIPRTDIVDVTAGLKLTLPGGLLAYLAAIVPITQDGLRADVVPTGGVEIAW